MKLLEKILVPIDVNTDSKEHINTAIELAKTYNSEIIVMYVLPTDVLNESVKDIVIRARSEEHTSELQSH